MSDACANPDCQCNPPDIDKFSPDVVGMFWACPTCRQLWTVTEQTSGTTWAKANIVWRDDEGNLLVSPRKLLPASAFVAARIVRRQA